MAVAVVVPWRAGCPEREAALRWVAYRWRSFYSGWDLVLGSAPPGPWCKARAVWDALGRTSADIVILADADVWTDGIDAAVDVVTARGGWAIPHWHVHRLDLASTEAVLDGGPLAGNVLRRPYPGYPGGGMTVVARDLLEAAPLDPRFVGWGTEDQAASLAWQALAGKPWRGAAELWHLWHPPQPKISAQFGSKESEAHWPRYQAAARQADGGDLAQMRQLLAEARALLDQAREVADA